MSDAVTAKLSAEMLASLAAIDDLSERLRASLQATSITRPHPLMLAVRRDRQTVLLAPSKLWHREPSLFSTYRDQAKADLLRFVLLGSTEKLHDMELTGVTALLGSAPTVTELRVAVEQGFLLMQALAHSESRGRSVVRYEYELGELIEIARALTTEREIGALLELILEKSRFITGADAGSLYVVEGSDPNIEQRTLHFKVCQNDSVQFDWSEFTMPISRRSMAGWVALERQPIRIADVYALPPNSQFEFDRTFDVRIGYRTKSMLCAPLVSARNEVIGVLQLINKKRDPRRRLGSPADVDSEIIAFDDRSEQLLLTLSAQAGIALENAQLYDEIRGLFEGFVKASVDAIEARDPTTSGHSRRVAALTLRLAQAVHDCSTGPYSEVQFDRECLREIEYASLLHDFGKIGVREHVLVKAKKLYPHELEQIRLRFELVSRSLEVELFQRRMEVLSRGGTLEEFADLDREFDQQRAELAQALETVMAANEPSVLRAGAFERIAELGQRSFRQPGQPADFLLSAAEVESLSVTRGSLTPREFDEIRAHVSHTFRFLSRIPWSRNLRRVPVIAGAHHERIDGTGYPERLSRDQIPLEAKMMSVADIFDALTASDRPYKRAVTVQKALDILGLEVKDGHLDPDLVRLFSESQAWAGIAE